MGKYIKVFELTHQYEEYINSASALLPNVSLTEDDDMIYYNPNVHKVVPNYLTFTAVEDSVIRLSVFNIDDNIITTDTPDVNLEYSMNGIDFQQWNYETQLYVGETLYLRGDNPNGFSSEQILYTFGTSAGKFECHGNIMSLLYKDDFEDKLTIPSNCCFGCLFRNFNSGIVLVELDEVDAPYTLLTAPELPATTLAPICYFAMFIGCTALTTAPELPATTLELACYADMFIGCTALTTAPELPATTLVSFCYDNMFSDCISLNYIKMLATNIQGDDCFGPWVNNVSPTGTFVKHAGLNIYDYNIIPDGDWYIETYMPNLILNGWDELYPNIESFNIVNDSDTDISINFHNDNYLNLNAHTKINMTGDEIINSHFSHEFVFDILYFDMYRDTNCVIKDVIYRNDYWVLGDLLQEYIIKYSLDPGEEISIVIKNVADSNLLPNGWTYLYENVKPFTIVNKTNGELSFDDGNDVIYIYPDEEYNIYDVSQDSLKPNAGFKLDILLSNNNENIVVLSEWWGSYETLQDAIIRINYEYNNILNNYNEQSLVIYNVIYPE